jgi:hypothetical protein
MRDAIGQEIQSRWEEGEAAYREVGRMLLDRKAQLGHGKFQTWFRAQRFRFREREARRYMQLAQANRSSRTVLNDLRQDNEKRRAATASRAKPSPQLRAVPPPTAEDWDAQLTKDVLELMDLFQCKTRSLTPARFMKAYRASDGALDDAELSRGLASVFAWFEDVQRMLEPKETARHG